MGVAVGGWLRPQHGTQTVDGDDVHDVVRPLVVTLPGDADPASWLLEHGSQGACRLDARPIPAVRPVRSSIETWIRSQTGPPDGSRLLVPENEQVS